MLKNKYTPGRRFTKQELSFIRDNWDKIPGKDIAAALETSYCTIYRAAKRLNLPKLERFKRGWILRPYNKSEESYILNNLGSLDKREIAIHLGRHPNYVYRFIKKKYPHLVGYGNTPFRQYPREMRLFAQLIFETKRKINEYG